MITVIGNRTLCRSVIILVIKQLGLPLRGRPILFITRMISIGNSMINSDIWHKYHTWYFEIVTRPVYVVSRAEWNLRQFRNITSGLYAKYHVQLMLFKFVYTTTRKRFAISTCRYSKLSWNTTSLSQSNCRNFSCSSIMKVNSRFHFFQWRCFQIKHYSQTSMPLMATSPQRPFFWWTVHTLQWPLSSVP